MGLWEIFLLILFCFVAALLGRGGPTGFVWWGFVFFFNHPSNLLNGFSPVVMHEM